MNAPAAPLQITACTPLAQPADQPNRRLTVTPVSQAVGANVSGVSLATISDAEFVEVRAAWHQYSALLFQGQQLTDDELLSFSRRFGSLDEAPLMENGQSVVAGKPEVYVISNVRDSKGQAIGSLGSGEAVWHTDMSYLECPPDASILYSLEVPDEGGNTSLGGMKEAFRQMPRELLDAVKGRSIKHDGTYNSGGLVRQGVRQSDDPMTCVGAAHPIICRHPETGIETLYLGRRRNAYVIGMPLAESEALLDRLWAHATQEKFTYEHKWQIGDLLLWDNRSTLHRREPFDDKSRRVMHRTQITGKVAPRRAL